ncbi:MAG: ABC transporter substrate-binding protein [Gemmatimonadota bacterium]|nr:ABC transporter substrate-binding protein [Gemmatimonadota bacterium]
MAKASGAGFSGRYLSTLLVAFGLLSLVTRSIGGIVMFSGMRILSVFAVVASLTWGCGSERLTTSQVPESGEQYGQSAGKHAFNGMTRAVVVASVTDGEMPASGVKVEFTRSVSGRAASFDWSGSTNARGQAHVHIAGAGVTGYYRARAMRDGSEIGSWSSIPVNSGYQSSVELRIGEKANTAGSIALTPGGLPAKIAIGVAMPLTGPQDVYGLPALEGFELAQAEINNSSILSGASIEFIVEDTEGTIDAATAAFNKLINEDGVDVILGPGISTVGKEVFPIAQQNEVLAFSSTSTAVGLSAIGDYIFRSGLNVGTLVPGAVKDLQEKLGFSRVVTMVDDADVYSRSLDEAVSNSLGEGEVEILSRETFATGDTSFTDQLNNIKELNPHALFVSCLAAEMIQIMIEAREIGISSDIPIIIPEMTMDEVAAAGDAAERVISITSWATNAATPGNQTFIESYITENDSEPGPWAALSYASLYILADAIADAGSTNASAIKDAMAATRDVDTILGRFSFNADGDAVYDPIVLVVREGAFELFE